MTCVLQQGREATEKLYRLNPHTHMWCAKFGVSWEEGGGMKGGVGVGGELSLGLVVAYRKHNKRV